MLKKVIPVLLLLSVSTAFADLASESTSAHNKWRNMLNNGELENQPRPSPFIQDVVYDANLANLAKTHSERCVWEHSGAGGENLYAYSRFINDPGLNVNRAVDLWSDEYKNYNYDSNKSHNGKVIGHYTQVVWDDSTRVGCGIASCSPLYTSQGEVLFSNSTVLTCRYKQPGNWVGHKPYSTKGYNGKELATINELNFNVEVPALVFKGDMYRLKMSLLPMSDDDDNYDFQIDTYEKLYKSNRTDTNIIYKKDKVNYMKLIFSNVKVLLKQIPDQKGIVFRFMEVID